MTSTAFVTKSYRPDLERCELICRSIELLAPGTSHWIIVDSRDRAAFRSLEKGTTRIVTTEELLPLRVRRFDVYGIDKNLWLGAHTTPMRGWLVQQLAKLAITFVASEDVLIHGLDPFPLTLLASHVVATPGRSLLLVLIIFSYSSGDSKPSELWRLLGL